MKIEAFFVGECDDFRRFQSYLETSPIHGTTDYRFLNSSQIHEVGEDIKGPIYFWCNLNPNDYLPKKFISKYQSYIFRIKLGDQLQRKNKYFIIPHDVSAQVVFPDIKSWVTTHNDDFTKKIDRKVMRTLNSCLKENLWDETFFQWLKIISKQRSQDFLLEHDDIQPLRLYNILSESDWFPLDIINIDLSDSPFMIRLDDPAKIRTYFALRSELILNHHHKKSRLADDVEILDWMLTLVHKPVAVFNMFGDLVWQNRSFVDLQLLPKRVLSLKARTPFEANKIFFYPDIHEFDNDGAKYYVYTFSEVHMNKEMKLSSNDYTDLGIMTSSIAHELNNPIAGVLAGVELVFALDPNLPGHINDGLEQVKKSALRCRDLVRTFLGFTKARINQQGYDLLSLEEIFQQAVSLVRSRLMESNVSWNWEISIDAGDKSFEIYNQSVLVMIFYMTLNEVITVASRESLIRLKDLKSIYGQLYLTDAVLNLRFHLAKDAYARLEQSALFEHLLDIEKMTVSCSGDEISFHKCLMG